MSDNKRKRERSDDDEERRRIRRARKEEKKAAGPTIKHDSEERKQSPARDGQQEAKSSRTQRRRRRKNMIKGPQQELQPSKPHTETKHPVSTTRALADASWTVSEPLGGKFLDVAPVFAEEEKHLLLATEHALGTYSMKTSALERSIPAGLDDQITSYAPSTTNRNIVYAGTLSGYVITWDWTKGQCLDRWKSGSRTHGLATAQLQNASQENVFALAKRKGSWRITVRRCGLEGGLAKAEHQTLLTTEKPIRSLRVSTHGQFIFATMPDALLLGKVRETLVEDEALEYVWREIPCKQAPTCLDVRPSASGQGQHAAGDIDLVYGDLTGAIYVYQNIFHMLSLIDKPQKRASKGRTTDAMPLIWHKEAVGAVAFSRDGNYIVSGGRETVLVLWQLDTGKKQFLPHLESPIQSLTISPSGALYAVGLGDNSVMVLSTAELTPIAHFAGLQSPATYMLPTHQSLLPTKEVFEQVVAGDAPDSVRAVVNPTQPDQVLCAVPSHQSAQNNVFPANPPTPYLQTISVGSDTKSTRHLSRQGLARTNATETNTGPDMNRLQEPNITHMAISHNGRWLATVDEWAPPTQDLEDLLVDSNDTIEELSKHREITLRIWEWHTSTNKDSTDAWQLNQRIDSPHLTDASRTPGRILALVAQPDQTSFATVGEDCTVRVWAPKTRLQNGNVYWSEDPEVVVKGKKLQKEQTQTWWVARHAISLPSPMQEEATSRRTPSRAVLAYSNDASILAAHLHFDTMSDALVRGTTFEAEIEPVEEDDHCSLVHFVDTSDPKGVSLRHSQDHMCPSNVRTHDQYSLLLKDGVHALGFLERHLIILTRQAAYVWDVTDYSLVSEMSLPSLASSSTQAGSVLSSPPPPQLAINLSTLSFAISAPIYKHRDKELPSHSHRDYTSQLQVHRVEASEPLSVQTLARLSLSLLALQRGFLGLDVTASLHIVRPPLAPGALIAPTMREDSPAEPMDTEEIDGPVEIIMNGAEPQRAPLAPRLVPEQKLAEVLEYGGPAESMARGRRSFVGGLPSVREMFEGVLDLFVNTSRSVAVN